MKSNQDHAAHTHWSEEGLLRRLYGLEGGESGCDCTECAARWRALNLRRAQVLASTPAPAALDERLRAQRGAIWRRLEQPRPGMSWQAVPAAATALVLLVGVALHQPAPRVTPQPAAATATLSDEQLLSEVASILSQETPRATDPMRALFAESGATEAR